MELTVLISCLGVAFTIIGTIIGYRNGLKKEGNAEGSMRSDIGYIKSSVDDLKNEQRQFNTMHYELSERVGRVEESAKSAHHRIDTIESQLK